MKQKAALIKMGVENNIYDIDEIKNIYNEYAKGGEVEKNYNTWKKKLLDYKNINVDEDNTYDYLGFYNSNPDRAWDMFNKDSNAHFIDEYKTVYHPTFSNQSIYSGKKSKFNPLGVTGGTWSKDGKSYVLSPSQGNYRWDVGNTMDYLGVAEDNGVEAYYPDGRHFTEPNGEIWGGVLPNVTVIRNRSYGGGGKVKKQNKVNPKAVYALNYFMNKGLSKEQAAGLVGNFMRESSMNITALNPYSGAYGLGQWLGGRKKKLFSMYGNNPTLQNQLDFTWHELNSSHGKGLRMLKQSKTVDEAAANAFGYYEFSGGPQAAVRAMNNAGMNTKWKNPNGTLALNGGIEKARLLLGIDPTTVTSNPTQNYNFEATVAPALQPVQMKPIEIPDLKFSDASLLAEEKKEDNNNDEQLLEQQLQKDSETKRKNQLMSVFNFLNQKSKTQKNTPTNNYTIHI